MIHIDRAGVSPPTTLFSPRVQEAKDKTWETYNKGKLQESLFFDDKIWLDPEVVGALRQLFFDKCAFCEQPLTGTFMVAQYRPKMQAVSLDGKIDLFHYFWLAYEWSNLFLICSECDGSKGTRFPIKGDRARVGADLSELGSEETLLLNPCEDFPEQHLVFSLDGMVTSQADKGRVTIEVFGLNRSSLLMGRRNEYAVVSAELAKLEDQPAGERDKGLEILNDPRRPFAGMRRQFIGEWLQALRKKIPEAEIGDVAQQATQQPVFSKRQQRTIKSDYKKFKQSQEAFSMGKAEDRSQYYLRTRWIEKIEIHNFKIIKDLTLYPTAAKRSEGPWLMLLGENGTGKSSVLQAIALALIGDQYRSKLAIRPEEVLRNRCKSGFVKIHLAGATQPVELNFFEDEPNFKSNLLDPNLLLLGYGATRLLPRDSVQSMPGTEFAHVDNLLNPFVPLKDASRWLYDLHEKDPVKFDNVARALKNLLTLKEAEELVCDPDAQGQVNMRAFGQNVSIKRQSDGYQTVLALACDIMAILLERWEAMEVAEGIVLIDEIGSHLHPRWQMHVIQSLRQVFPRVQFLVTTHYPLCLRGLYNQEVIILQRTPQHKIIAVDRDLPPIEGMRVDQLLTSEYFSLNSTIDPELDVQFNEYYQLLATRKRTQEQEKRLDELKNQLDQHRVFGNTRRQRLAMEAIDDFLAQEPEIVSLDQRSDLKEETKRKVAGLWAQVLSKK